MDTVPAYQLCAPQRITLNDAAALARMARVFGDVLSEILTEDCDDEIFLLGSSQQDRAVTEG